MVAIEASTGFVRFEEQVANQTPEQDYYGLTLPRDALQPLYAKLSIMRHDVGELHRLTRPHQLLATADARTLVQKAAQGLEQRVKEYGIIDDALHGSQAIIIDTSSSKLDSPNVTLDITNGTPIQWDYRGWQDFLGTFGKDHFANRLTTMMGDDLRLRMQFFGSVTLYGPTAHQASRPSSL